MSSDLPSERRRGMAGLNFVLRPIILQENNVKLAARSLENTRDFPSTSLVTRLLMNLLPIQREQWVQQGERSIVRQQRHITNFCILKSIITQKAAILKNEDSYLDFRRPCQPLEREPETVGSHFIISDSLK